MFATMVPSVQLSKFIFKSDIPKNHHATAPSGILHAFRSSSRREHCFAWISDVTFVENVVQHLHKYGFARTRMVFVPYSSKANWMHRYPHAVPHVQCDGEGAVTGYPYFYHDANTARDVPEEAARRASVGESGNGYDGAAVARRSRKGAKFLQSALLLDAEREELHKEIYIYFSWLQRQLREVEGSSLINARTGIDAEGFTTLMAGMKTTFKVLQKRSLSISLDGGAPPLLEECLQEELSLRAAASRPAKRSDQPPARTPKWEPPDFDTMYEKLLEFKQEYGHVDVPARYKKDPSLGSWVAGLRKKKQALEQKGIDLDAEAQMEKPDPPPGKSQRYLDKDKVERLNAVGLSWKLLPGRCSAKPWEETFRQLKEFHHAHGRWPSRSDPLGAFVKDQRKFYKRKDPKFMLERAPLLEEIGFPWRGVAQEETDDKVVWDNMIEKMVEFHKANGHFNVPQPISEEVHAGGDEGNSNETYETFKLYKWVQRLGTDYKNYISGKKSKYLDEKRMQQLADIGFYFDETNGKTSSVKDEMQFCSTEKEEVPHLPWETRIYQLKSFYNDVGHLNIDHNYRLCGNLGGWAVQMSIMYKNWKEGGQVSPEVEEKFNQLSELGFKFNVFHKYDNNRSWDDHFNELVKYKQAHGHARIPLKYKADMRLGKWVQRLRSEYKKVGTGTSKRGKFLTEERIHRLNSLGFEWSLEGIGYD
eukprot:CCRYP_016739-RA/>CCRYP_016739-RA protein AED:0.05 eAED:0.05 QI:1/1/1/1/1/1/3/5305/702